MGPADIDRWNPRAIRDVADAAASRAAAAEAASAGLAALPSPEGWAGVAATAAGQTLLRLRADLDTHAAQARALAGAAARAADEVAVVKDALRRLDDDARTEGLRIDRDSGRVVATGLPDGVPGRLSGPAAALGARLASLLIEADAVDAGLARAVGLAGEFWPAPALPAAAAGPAAVGDWWDSLTRAERAAVARSAPERLGDLDGVPVAERDLANRAVLTGDLSRVEGAAAARRVPVAQVLDDPVAHGLSPAVALRYPGARAVRDALAIHAARPGAAPLLLIYQPQRFGGQGRAAIALGNPDLAAHTAVLVPGTGSSVTSGWLAGDDLADLFAKMAAATGSGVAVSAIGWMGYDSPDSLSDPRVTHPGLARRGGAQLARDMAGLAETGRADARRTVIGHSYGSTTVADAAAGYGMRAHDVVLLGSPGTDLARTAADFRLPPGGAVYVGAASTDPVTFVAGAAVGLGADPAAAGYGSTRFKAEIPGINWKFWQDHGDYLDRGTESLRATAHVAAGDGHRLAGLSLTAPHRTSLLGPFASLPGIPNWSSPLRDPELRRAAGPGT
jgi:hypothetical protein